MSLQALDCRFSLVDLNDIDHYPIRRFDEDESRRGFSLTEANGGPHWYTQSLSKAIRAVVEDGARIRCASDNRRKKGGAGMALRAKYPYGRIKGYRIAPRFLRLVRSADVRPLGRLPDSPTPDALPIQSTCRVSSSDYQMRILESLASRGPFGPAKGKIVTVGATMGKRILRNDFSSEREMQNYLARNLHDIEGGLCLIERNGKSGVEFLVGGRRIDILCEDRDGSLVVLELKVNRRDEAVVGQILLYINLARLKLAALGQHVRGIIVCHRPSHALRIACASIPAVQLFSYSVSSGFAEVQRLQLPTGRA